MSKYEELKSRQIKTVGELIKVLSQYPEETKVKLSSANEAGMFIYRDNNGIELTDFVFLAGIARAKEDISREEYKELCNKTG
jgi:hypothetical protein